MRAEPGRPPAAAAARPSVRPPANRATGGSESCMKATAEHPLLGVWPSISYLLSKSGSQYDFFILIIQKWKLGVRPQFFSYCTVCSTLRCCCFSGSWGVSSLSG